MDCETAILKTLTYSDLFDYPLTRDQLYTFLIAKKSYIKQDIIKVVKNLKEIVYKDGFYAFTKRENIIENRIKRQKDNHQKLEKARSIALMLSYIPTIYYIGISGSLALQNAKKDDDIDLFVITKKNTVWISRLLLLFLLHILGVRRTRADRKVKEKVCLNMVIAQDAMAFKKDRQDVYTAHEIAQVVPLVSRATTYPLFLAQNNWVISYMPHAFTEEKHYLEKKRTIFFESMISLPVFEYSAKILQQAIIKKHKTSETVTENFLAFHPFDYREKTLNAYEKRIKKYE